MRDQRDSPGESGYLSLFRMPKPVTINGRFASITNSFINAIIPVFPPGEEEVKAALSILGMDRDSFQCAYCGGTASEWDHLRPLVLRQKPTGYISEINNLVPACGKCNQSKGNRPWEQWIISSARWSPRSRGIEDLSKRIIRLKLYERWREPTWVDFEAVMGRRLWRQHWKNWARLRKSMEGSQALAVEINQRISAKYSRN